MYFFNCIERLTNYVNIRKKRFKGAVMQTEKNTDK